MVDKDYWSHQIRPALSRWTFPSSTRGREAALEIFHHCFQFLALFFLVNACTVSHNATFGTSPSLSMDRLSAILAQFASICGDHRIKQQKPLTKADAAAEDVIDELAHAEKSGRMLKAAINDIAIRAGGWSEYFAKAILHLLETVLKAGAPMGAAMRDAYNRSVHAAEKMTTFAKDHPVLCTVVALGILEILAPFVISALGFTAEGVLEGESFVRCL